MLLYLQLITVIIHLSYHNGHAQEQKEIVSAIAVIDSGEIIVQCTEGQRVCTLHGYQYCINSLLICDGWWHCADGADETDCVCSEEEFQCESGGCLPLEKLCDGGTQCTDKSDESQCVCPEGEFKCTIRHQCINSRDRCDGTVQCSDGTDEKHCVCDESEFVCEAGGCIDGNRRCDGKAHCQDRSDEKDCVCDDDEFACVSGGCVSNFDVCDGLHHCDDGSDEQNCSCRPDDEFSCLSGGCVASRFKCDERNDCEDASDESDCPRKFQNSQIVTYPAKCPDEYPLKFLYDPTKNNEPFNLRVCNPTCIKDETIYSAFKGHPKKYTSSVDIAIEIQFNYDSTTALPGFLLRRFCTTVKGVKSLTVIYLGEDPYPVSFTRTVDLTVVNISSDVCTSLLQVHLKTLVIFYHKAESRDMMITKTSVSLCLRPQTSEDLVEVN